MALYMIAVVNIQDAESYRAYEQGAIPTLEGYGVEVLAYGVPRGIEGKVPAQRAALLKFKDQETFDRWYASPAYQAVKQIRIEHAESPFIITLEGL